MKVADLSGAVLDFWVAKAEGHELVTDPATIARAAVGNGRAVLFRNNAGTLCIACAGGREWSPSTDPRQSHPIIERERIQLEPFPDVEWLAFERFDGRGEPPHDSPCRQYGPTALIAAMRARVASKYGEEVPDDIETPPITMDCLMR
ncbi:phage protein NinX family protein [Pararobbsia alpina]|uniref:DUF2591 domain-containing protein n=1 Tax=Pararobbsia alpina TaxID=621374 RepID=A0A6S7CTB5_9BURK|nr:phage protein NinX family protein [Pararobbsia alpina]CAB3797407.1 hypothetical protein LMG28138_04240 [Pararobbsia alpina]